MALIQGRCARCEVEGWVGALNGVCRPCETAIAEEEKKAAAAAEAAEEEDR